MIIYLKVNFNPTRRSVALFPDFGENFAKISPRIYAFTHTVTKHGTHTHVYVYTIFAYSCIRIRTYMYTYIHTYIHNVYMYVYVCVCVLFIVLCVHIYTYDFIYVYTYVLVKNQQLSSFSNVTGPRIDVKFEAMIRLTERA